MKKQLSLLALASMLALALALSGRAEEKMKPAKAKAEKAPRSQEPSYSAACASPCEFSLKSHNKSEVAAILKEHAKSHHQTVMSDKDVDGMIKTKVAKKD